MRLIPDILKNLNKKRRRALIEFLIRENFKELGYRKTRLRISDESDRISITDGSGLVISFDIGYASDFREDAYKWCYVDFFIKRPGIDIPDDLKRRFTRYIDSESKKLYWRHREMARIIDMDQAVEYIVKIKNELLDLLRKYDVKI